MGRMAVPVLAGAALLTASGASAQVVVNPSSGRVSIRASGQAVSTLLDQLAQKTGMAVDYEKSPPRQTVSLTLEDRTPAQAVVAILEGLNIPYALSLTADGLNVQTLVIADASAPPKGARPRVGRETSMAPPDEPQAGDAPTEQPDPTQVEPQQEEPQGEPTQRRGAPPPPPVTLAPAFPNSPFGGSDAPEPRRQPEPRPEA